MSNKIQALGATQSSLAQQQRTVANKKKKLSPRCYDETFGPFFNTWGMEKFSKELHILINSSRS